MSYNKFAFTSLPAGSSFDATMASFGKYLYVPVLSGATSTIRKYDVSNGSYITYNIASQPYSMGLSPDGNTLITFSKGRTMYYIATSSGDGSTMTAATLSAGTVVNESGYQGNMYVTDNGPTTFAVCFSAIVSGAFVGRQVNLSTGTNTYNSGISLVALSSPGGAGAVGYSGTGVRLYCDPSNNRITGGITITGIPGARNAVITSDLTTLYAIASNGDIYTIPTGQSGAATLFLTNTYYGTPNGGFTLNTYNGTNTFFLTSGDANGYYIYRLSTVNKANCFREGTQILCLENDQEIYKPIETLISGDLVKTFRHGYKPISLIARDTVHNPAHSRRVRHRLFKLSPEQYPELTQDLYLTGEHAILVDSLTEEQSQKIIDDSGKLFVTDDKYRLIAYFDERAHPCEEEGEFNVWNFSLESENCNDNFGVYANGLLVETTFDSSLLFGDSMKLVISKPEDIERIQKIFKKYPNPLTIKN